MNQTTLVLGGVGVFLVLLVFLVIAVRRFAKRKTAEWVQQASALGLTASGGYPRLAMAGTLEGTSVILAHQSKTTRSAGRKSHSTTKTWCEAAATIPGGTGDLEVAEEGVFASLGKLVGGTDHKTGDDAFDRKFLVKGSAQHAAYLTPPARAALIGLEANLRGEVTVSGGAVKWRGSSVGHEQAVLVLRALAGTARAFKS